ncbi:uncharacterized protein LOC105845123 [Hydra vulgaris]|uniref:uncharacterized protein LOC105845123 n=1 Tax=Hydra vulgaris TaxID=6087 RepID=UPI001F5E5D55|nr:uncharacterized protein LOC105845123 [Hydra vulgaris]
MGLDNYACEEDHRLKPWDKTLPVFNSMKVGSENDIRKSDDVQESSLDHNSICFVTKPYVENPYCVLPEKGKNYNERAPSQFTIESRFQNNSRTLLYKKTNSMYETTEVEPKIKHRRKHIKGYFSGIEDNSKCSYLVFSVLVAIIAITSAVMVFMILFGVISVQKCKECKLLDLKSEKQTQINANDDVKSKLKQLSEDFNTTNVKTDDLYAKIVKDEIRIDNLTRQLNEQIKLLQLLIKKNDEIANLTRDEIKNFTEKLEIDTKTVFESRINFIDVSLNKVSINISSINDDVYWLKNQLHQTNRSISNLTLREGIQGPRGYNGSEGRQGKSANFTSCRYDKKDSTGTGKQVNAEIKKDQIAGKAIITAFCTISSTGRTEFEINENLLICKCIFDSAAQGNKCYIHYWHC